MKPREGNGNLSWMVVATSACAVLFAIGIGWLGNVNAHALSAERRFTALELQAQQQAEAIRALQRELEELKEKE